METKQRRKPLLEESMAHSTAPTLDAALSTARGAGTSSRSGFSVNLPRYEGRSLLGVGGMGEVNLCRDAWIGREVAVKTVTSEDSSGSARERFVREARVQGQLEHPSIVPVYDVGVDEHGNDFFTMKRISGRTLAEIISALAAGDRDATEEFPRSKLLGIHRQVCLAIGYAHSRGVVHRDLKPANVMVGAYGEVYVLDWGLAKVRDPASARSADDEQMATVAGQMLGTPGYMAPEQIGAANSADERADVYALGAILFELLALEPLHAGASIAELVRSTQIGAEDLPSLRAPERNVPPELDTLCRQATLFSPSDRIQSAREIAEGIERFLEGDRDAEARRESARRHAAVASEKAEIARAGGPEATEARVVALREASLALALDPEGRQGLRPALELMLDPPRVIPPEVRAEFKKLTDVTDPSSLWASAGTFLSFFLFVGTLSLIMPVRNPGGIAVVLGGQLTAAVLAAIATHQAFRDRRRLMINLSGVFGFASMGAAYGFLGPATIVPTLAVAFSLSWLSIVRASRLSGLGLGLAAYVVPYLLEWAGILPQCYVWEPNELHVKAVFIGFPEVASRVGLLVSLVGAHVGAAVSVLRVTRAEERIRQKWVLQNWHLRKMTMVEA